MIFQVLYDFFQFRIKKIFSICSNWKNKFNEFQMQNGCKQNLASIKGSEIKQAKLL